MSHIRAGAEGRTVCLPWTRILGRGGVSFPQCARPIRECRDTAVGYPGATPSQLGTQGGRQEEEETATPAPQVRRMPMSAAQVNVRCQRCSGAALSLSPGLDTTRADV